MHDVLPEGLAMLPGPALCFPAAAGGSLGPVWELSAPGHRGRIVKARAVWENVGRHGVFLRKRPLHMRHGQNTKPQRAGWSLKKYDEMK